MKQRPHNKNDALSQARLDRRTALCIAGALSLWTFQASAQTPVDTTPEWQPINPRLLFQDPAQPPYPKVQNSYPQDDWTRHFRVGGMVGLNIKAKFSTSSGGFNISGNPPGSYDDGYVRTDATGNAGGLTSNWGYDNASQYNGQSLTMHSATSFTTDGFSGTTDDTASPGLDLAYGGNLWNWRSARIGWDFGFGLMPINISENHSGDGLVTQSSFTFDTGGIVVPGAPYHGGPNGGPVIHANYTSTDTTTSPGTISGDQTLDVILYSFRLGPSAYWDLGRYVGVSVGAGPALGLVSGSLEYSEKITANGVSTRNKGQIDDTVLVYGGYVNASVMIHAVEHGDIYLGAQYMPMTEASFSGQGRKANLELGGQLLLSVGFNWPF